MHDRRRLLFDGGGKYPEYTYTGTHEFIDDGEGNWRIKFLTSGVFTLLNNNYDVDVFLVGGGGGGGGGYDNGSMGNCYGGGGGGGGYTKTVKNMEIKKGTPYDTTVGAKGSGGGQISGGQYNSYGKGGDGGASIFNGETAEGGKGGNGGGGGYYATDSRGGDGGSGGGAGGSGSAPSSTSMAGGTNGGNGGNFTSSSMSDKSGGTGQGTTTREFGEDDGIMYSTGGDGGQYNVSPIGPVAGSDCTGDGGDGGGIYPDNSENYGASVWSGASGGSGIVIIRNAGWEKSTRFYVNYNGTTYRYNFLEDMTWEEFVASEYNDGNFTIEDNKVMFMTEWFVKQDTIAVKTDIITMGVVYVASNRFYPVYLFDSSDGSTQYIYSMSNCTVNNNAGYYTLQVGEGGSVEFYVNFTDYSKLTINLNSSSVDLFIRNANSTVYYLKESDLSSGSHTYDISNITGYVYISIDSYYYDLGLSLKDLLLEY